MEIQLDLSKLTAAEVDLIEDTLNERCARILRDRVVGFEDLIAQFRWEQEVVEANEKGEERPPFPPGAVKVPAVKVMRALELVQLRRENKNATWDDTGQNPLFTGITEPPTGAAADTANGAPQSWPTTSEPYERSAELASSNDGNAASS